MKQLLICAVCVIALPQASLAQTFAQCTKTERGQFIAATQRSERLAMTATTAIGPNPSFQRWFGGYNRKSGEIVRRNLKAMVKALRSQKISAVCHNTGEDLCDGRTFAFVNKDVPYRVHVCPTFFKMDTMKDLTAETVAAGNGTRAGTLIHEVSHFTEVADTQDICYSREECSAMAQEDPSDSLLNADNYQYFVEDVTYFGVMGEGSMR